MSQTTVGAKAPSETYRVFISYSHEDRDKAFVRNIVEALKANGLTPLYDDSTTAGGDFAEQLKVFISYAHVFMPVLTKDSSGRGWVHQEIGYAMALNVPVLPVAIGELPEGMIQKLLAEKLDPDPVKTDVSAIRQKLPLARFQGLVSEATETKPPLYECQHDSLKRTKALVQYATSVTRMGQHGCVRQKGSLTSFNAPNEFIGADVWAIRWDTPRDDSYRQAILEERRALEAHVAGGGARLIMDPVSNHGNYSPRARSSRLRTLLDFLQNPPHEDVFVALESNEHRKSTIIVGDWFSAESVSARIGHGYRQTIFTRHAPTVRQQIGQFDEEFDYLLRKQGIEIADSRQHAIDRLSELVKDLETELDS